MIRVPSKEAKNDVSKYVCSDCWGNLAIFPDPEDRHVSILKCSTPGCACDGMVRQSTVDRRLAESRAQKEAAINATRETVPWIEALFPKKKRTEAEILKELGY